MKDVSTATDTYVTVTIVSIWSKDPLDPKRKDNVVYDVLVPETSSNKNDILEMAYALTNSDGRPFGHLACSTTAGDIMILDGQHYLVEPMGFRGIIAAESMQIQKLTSRDTSFGYDFMIKHNIIKAL